MDAGRWLSVNEKGEHIERIYIEACLNPDQIRVTNIFANEPCLKHLSHEIDFQGGRCYSYFSSGFKARVRGQYLTPHILYTLNLVFRYKYEHQVNSNIPLQYKIDGEENKKALIIYASTHSREDGWFVVPLYQFTSQHTTADLQLQFGNLNITLLVAGFEFQPSEEKVELQVFEEYQHIIEAASQSLACRSLQELKQILRIGIHLNDYKTWFSLNKKGEHCHLISMKDCLIPNEDFTPRYWSNGWSRFPAGLYDTNGKGFKTHVKTELLSPLITYTVNLFFTGYHEKEYLDFKYRLKGKTTYSTVKFAKTREADFFLIAELCQFNSYGSIVDIEIDFEDHGTPINIEGISFEPLEKVEDQAKKDKVKKKLNFKFWKTKT
nr:protein kinase-like domain, phloem protein 2-like protein [Tanacetum cinerariifolium]